VAMWPQIAIDTELEVFSVIEVYAALVATTS
jgi:hypothetical protein